MIWSSYSSFESSSYVQSIHLVVQRRPLPTHLYYYFLDTHCTCSVVAAKTFKGTANYPNILLRIQIVMLLTQEFTFTKTT